MKLPQIKGRFTWPDFPEQDWKLWEARKFSRPPNGATIDTSYMDTRPCCIHCATWICAGCWDWRRSRATRAVSQYCGRCGSTEGFFSAVRHYHDHMALPMVPFLVPVINDERASIVRQLEEALGDRLKARAAADRVFSTACPAGNPCPATGCPACCPSYDPCGEKSCRACNPGGEMHVPEEAEVGRALTQDEAVAKGLLPPKMGKCTYSCWEDGVNYPECPVHGGQELDILPHAVKMVSDKIREGHANGCVDTDRISMTIAEAKELCNLAVQPQLVPKQYPFQDGDGMLVLGPEVFAGPDEQVLVWKGEHFYKSTDEEVQKDHAVEKALKEVLSAQSEGRRREAMSWAVSIHTAGLGAGHIPTKSLSDTADDILAWLNKKS